MKTPFLSALMLPAAAAAVMGTKIKDISNKNHFNLNVNSIKIKTLEENAKQDAIFRLREKEEMEKKMKQRDEQWQATLSQRDEQWRTFCQQQENKFRQFISDIATDK